MTITETTNFFKSVLNATDKNREIKIYKSFIKILSSLEQRELSDDEILSIENEIETLKLKSNPENKRKYYGKALKTFKVYLKAEFSLVTEGYYMTLGMCLGMCFGSAVGTVFGTYGTSMGVSLGMLIGLVIGRTKDMEAEKENRVLKIAKI